MKLILKLALSFSAIVLAIMVLLITFLVYEHTSTQQIERMQRAYELNTFLVEREVDHMVWMENVTRMFATGQIPPALSDHRGCELGQWYYNFTPEPYNRRVYEDLEIPHRMMHEIGLNIVALFREGKREEALNLFNRDMEQAVNEVRRRIDAFQAVETQRVMDLKQEMARTRTTMSILFITLFVASLAVAVLMAYLLNRIIVVPTKRLSEIAEKVAQGDLTQEITPRTKDEIGELTISFSKMTHELRSIIGGLQDQSQQLLDASDTIQHSSKETEESAVQITTTMQDIANHSTEMASQADRLKDLSQSLQGIGQQTTQSIDQSRDKSANSKNAAQTGNDSLQAIIANLDQIVKTVEYATKAIQNLGKRSEQISEMVGLIQDIASQTNLLSLNAAIEAARAGEHGRGFAVVAQQIKTLAEESGKSATKITSLIEDILSETRVSVQSMEFNQEEIVRQLGEIKKAGNDFEAIVNAIVETDNLLHELEQSGNQLMDESQSLDEMVEQFIESSERNAANTEEVVATTQEQTAAMEEVASSAEIMKRLADDLQAAIQKFQV